MNGNYQRSWLKRAAIVAVVAGAGFAPGTGYSAAPGAGKWIQRQPKGPVVLVPHPIQIQCPSVETCYALGSQPAPATEKPTLEKTTDGGATWSLQQMNFNSYDPSVGTVRPLACPDATTCYVLRGTQGTDPTKATPGLVATRDGGKSWTHITLPGEGTANMISCPTSSVCYVSVSIADSAGGPPTEVLFATHDSGATWTQRSLTASASPGPPDILVCPTSTTCYIGATLAQPGGGPVGSQALVVTHDAGATWTSWQIGMQAGFTALACVYPYTCYATGNAALATTVDGGDSWNVQAAPWGYASPSFLACPAPATCEVLVPGLGIWHTSDAGATWRQARLHGDASLSDLACPAVTMCLAVGDAGLVLKSGDGLSWTRTSPPMIALTAVSCPTVHMCLAAGSDGNAFVTTNGGNTWVPHQADRNLGLGLLSCPSTRICTAIGWTGFGPSPRVEILRSADGGATWKVLKSFKRSFPGSMACPSVSECFVALQESTVTVADGMPGGSQVILRTADGGISWDASPLPSGYSVQSMSCPTTLTCVAVGGQEPCDDDLVPTRERPSPVRHNPTARDTYFPCNLELGWVFATFDGGKHWQRTAFRPQALFAVSCPDRSDCYSTGDGIWAKSADGGRHWSITTRPQAPRSGSVTSLTCVDRTTCWGLAFKQTGGTVPMRTANAGRSWQAVTRGLPPTTSEYEGAITSLACRSRSFCMAVGGGGLVLTYSP